MNKIKSVEHLSGDPRVTRSQISPSSKPHQVFEVNGKPAPSPATPDPQQHHFHHSQPYTHTGTQTRAYTVRALVHSVTDSPRNTTTTPITIRRCRTAASNRHKPSRESRCLSKGKTAKTTSRMDTDGQERSQRPDNFP